MREAMLPHPRSEAPPEPRLSRALLTPGPLPPLSHLGVTLLRHAVGSGLRYALYQLGLPVPDAPPVRIVRLRLYLDAAKLREQLGGAPGGEAVAAALLDPGGAGGLPGEARRLAAALALHRLRLRLVRPPAARPLPAAGTPEEAWSRFRSGFSRLLPRANDAFLADLAAALDRRARRARGQEVPPALSRHAWKLRTGRAAPLHLFGTPDPLAPSLAERPEWAEAARRALASAPLPPPDPFRGRFREAFRGISSLLSPLYHELARGAHERGLLDRPEDAFFLPMDLAADLTKQTRPAWLEAAVRTNRAEYESLGKAAEPLDLMSEKQEMGPPVGAKLEWGWGGLLPLA